MTQTIKTLIVIASTSLVMGTLTAVAGTNPSVFISEPDVGTSRVFKPMTRGVRYSRLNPSSSAGYISQPDVGTSRLWGLPKGASKHNQKLLMRRSLTKRLLGVFHFHSLSGDLRDLAEVSGLVTRSGLGTRIHTFAR